MADVARSAIAHNLLRDVRADYSDDGDVVEEEHHENETKLDTMITIKVKIISNEDDQVQHLLILRSLHLFHCFLCVSASLQSLRLWTM